MAFGIGLNCCCEPDCDICDDYSSPVSFILTPSGITTVSTPADFGDCSVCTTFNAPLELTLAAIGDRPALFNTVTAFCGAPAELPPDGVTPCMYSFNYTCAPSGIRFGFLAIIAVYVSTLGNLRCIVYTELVKGGDCTGTSRQWDDFELAAEATQFDCSAFDRTGTFTLTCTTDSSGCGCSAPTGYELTVSP